MSSASRPRGRFKCRRDVSQRVWWLASILALAAPVPAQEITYRGFIEGSGVAYPQDAPHDSRNLIGDVLARAELFTRPSPWLGFAVGADARANSYRQVEPSWRLDIADRHPLKPRLSIRRLSATLNRGPLTVDIGKQFIRWGKADILNPTDRFAPRDYMNVIEPDFLAVRAVRAVIDRNSQVLDVAWVPWFTPSRLPLLDQRWTNPPPGTVLVPQQQESLPARSQFGIRWGDTSGSYEYSLSFYDGYNHLPNIELPPVPAPADMVGASAPGILPIVKRYPTLRSYGGDIAVPTRWLTAKGELAYFTSSTPATDEYVLYVIQLERQSGEWFFVGGYAGEVVVTRGGAATFAPDRGIARTLLGRASYTIDVNRSAAIEAAVRQNGAGSYITGEYSQARGVHWRVTVSGAWIRGDPDDFLGQYRLNSHVVGGIRYSF